MSSSNAEMASPGILDVTGRLTVLHIGCGRRGSQEACGFRFHTPEGEEVTDITWLTLDGNASVNPDLVCVLGVDRIPLEDNSVNFVLAHHVIEHIGEIGKTEGWFFFWQELYRVMKPGAKVQFECPYHTSIWAWADPTHIRAMSEYTFLYLNQDAYTVGGSIPDYRPQFDFVLESFKLREDSMNEDIRAKEPASFINGILTARKPLRPYWERT